MASDLNISIIYARVNNKKYWTDAYVRALEDLTWEIVVGSLLLADGFEKPLMSKQGSDSKSKQVDWTAMKGQDLWVIEAKNFHNSRDVIDTYERQSATGKPEVHDVDTRLGKPNKSENPLLKKLRSTVANAVRQVRAGAKLHGAVCKAIYMNYEPDPSAIILEGHNQSIGGVLGTVRTQLRRHHIELKIFEVCGYPNATRVLRKFTSEDQVLRK